MKDTAGRAGGARDYSPNNHGFAMADRHGRTNVRVTENRPILGKSAIDNNPTPSYLSLGVGYLLLPTRFVSNLPEKCRIPERRRQIRPWRHDIRKNPAKLGAPPA